MPGAVNARRRSLYSDIEGRSRRTPELNDVSLAVKSHASGAAAITTINQAMPGKILPGVPHASLKSPLTRVSESMKKI